VLGKQGIDEKCGCDQHKKESDFIKERIAACHFYDNYFEQLMCSDLRGAKIATI
jgi:hypothetical protein